MQDIRPARPEDASLVSDILTEAFYDDPVMNWMFGGPKPISNLFSILTRHVYLVCGVGDVAGESAAALWLPANTRPKLSKFRELQLAVHTFKGGGIGAVRRMSELSSTLGANHPRAPHYYLFAVGVRKAMQGHGLGGRTIRKGLERADQDGVAAYLENSKARNTALYERCGFEATGYLPLPEGAPSLLAMVRPAREGGRA